MAKIYCLMTYRLHKELKELREFVESKYKYNQESPTMWFDHYSVTMAQTRIREIQSLLRELQSDKQVSTPDCDKKTL